MAGVGMRFPVVAPITSRVHGQSIVYGQGMVLGAGVTVTYRPNRRDNPLYADNVRKENDKGMTDYGLDVEVDDMVVAARKMVFGDKELTKQTKTIYAETAGSAPYVGYGNMTKEIRDGESHYTAWWYPCVQFAQAEVTQTTKRENIEWATAKLTGTGMVVNEGDVEEGAARYYAEFDTEAAAEAWLKEKAGIV